MIITMHAESRYMSVYDKASMADIQSSISKGTEIPRLLAALVCGRRKADESADYVLDSGIQGIWVIVDGRAVTFLRLSKHQRGVLGLRKNTIDSPSVWPAKRKANKGRSKKKDAQPLKIGSVDLHHAKEWVVSSRALALVSRHTGISPDDVLSGLSGAFSPLGWVGKPSLCVACIDGFVFVASRASNSTVHVDILQDVAAEDDQ